MNTIDRAPTMAGIRTLPEALLLRSEQQPDRTAFVFLRNGEDPEETVTYRELDEASRLRAAAFVGAGLAGRNVVLLFPSGIEFIRTLIGCMYAGVAGAPVQVPRRRQGVERLRRIADDAATTVVLTTGEVKRDLEERFGDSPELAGLTLIDTETLARPPVADGAAYRSLSPHPEGTALLQYTSGSTGDPKGVIITHSNFLSNVIETDELWPSGADGTVVSWLPLFHDMGMLFGIVLPLWTGVPSYLMPPDAFIRRPARWLEAISRFGGTHAAAPSFAYELCVRAAEEGRTADVGSLASWRVAVNGAEPVRWSTLSSFTEAFAPYGFDPRAMAPGYGLAENTLKATGSPQDRAPAPLWLSARALGEGRVEAVDPRATGATPVVSSGVPVLGTRVSIVDPTSHALCPPARVGEIWISGPCVSPGYLGRPQLSEETFRARIHSPGDAGSGTHLRTGDLGFLHDGELYVTGRIKDVLIRKGRNFYPQDIELSAESAVPGLHPNCAAAFSIDDGAEEQLVVVVEADGRVLRSAGAPVLRDRVREAIRENHRLETDRVLVVRRGALSKTSSGKVQRRACRRRYESGELDAVAVAVSTADAVAVTPSGSVEASR
ncbi:fatty acyl-AMP ligase [Streptomyces sp. NPDC051555]|uniref:fatty acyl-AMP ligase n=1 Tax=Streptomyces sp. NPDC051555 TaxID=3365657 RepID=UPI0037B1037E